jgi:hypothetical protein
MPWTERLCHEPNDVRHKSLYFVCHSCGSSPRRSPLGEAEGSLGRNSEKHLLDAASLLSKLGGIS